MTDVVVATESEDDAWSEDCIGGEDCFSPLSVKRVKDPTTGSTEATTPTRRRKNNFLALLSKSSASQGGVCHCDATEHKAMSVCC